MYTLAIVNVIALAVIGIWAASVLRDISDTLDAHEAGLAELRKDRAEIHNRLATLEKDSPQQVQESIADLGGWYNSLARRVTELERRIKAASDTLDGTES